MREAGRGRTAPKSGLQVGLFGFSGSGLGNLFGLSPGFSAPLRTNPHIPTAVDTNTPAMYFRRPGVITRQIVRVSLPGSDSTGVSRSGFAGVGVIGIGDRDSPYSINRTYYGFHATYKKPRFFDFSAKNNPNNYSK